VRAVLRRSADRPARAVVPPAPANAGSAANAGRRDGAVCFGNAWLDPRERRLLDRDGRELPITACEFDLLATFARHPNTVLSRERLMGGDRDGEASACDRAIDIRVTRIRKRIEVNPAKPQVIRTVRGAGYVYVPPA
jgi:DNA-binding response OmpR family regulator